MTFYEGRLSLPQYFSQKVLYVNEGSNVDLINNENGFAYNFTCVNKTLIYKGNSEDCFVSKNMTEQIVYSHPILDKDRQRIMTCLQDQINMLNFAGIFFDIVFFQCKRLTPFVMFNETKIPFEANFACVPLPNREYLIITYEDNVENHFSRKSLVAVCKQSSLKTFLRLNEDNKFVFADFNRLVTSESTRQICNSCAIDKYPTKKKLLLTNESETIRCPHGKMMEMGTKSSSDVYNSVILICEDSGLSYIRADGSKSTAPEGSECVKITPTKCTNLMMAVYKEVIDVHVSNPVLSDRGSFEVSCLDCNKTVEVVCDLNYILYSNAIWRKQILSECTRFLC